MSISFRKADIFAAGLLFGAAAVWLVVFLVSRGNSPDAARASVPAPQPVALAAAPRPPAPVAAAPKPAAVVAAAPRQHDSQCPVQPATTPGAGGDGRVKLQADLSGKSASDVASFIVAGKEAAAADRPRDAEVAFMMACRASESLVASNTLAPADARYQLGRHYANAVLAGDSGAGPKRAELLRRSEVLYSDSLQSYVAKYGQDHEKSRFAAEGLAKVQQNVSRSGRPSPLPAPALVARTSVPERPPVAIATRPAEAARPVAVAQPVPYRVVRTPTPSPQRRDDEVAVVSAPVRQATGEASRASPSFDCSRARSYSERTICADSELARLDRDLGRLHARAKSAASDSAAFRRRNDREWQRREGNCRDRECLVRWYAERRDQLLNDDAQNFSER
ncbi:MAG: hypothetical protein LH617_02740 [Ramlibacter sp.]|nr:hypothetical protein [Ramlibacter sp.]